MKTLATIKAWILICSIISVSYATEHTSPHYIVSHHGEIIPHKTLQNTIVPFQVQLPENVLSEDVSCISADPNIFQIMHKAQESCNGTEIRCTFYHFLNHEYKNIGTVDVDKELFNDLLMKFDNWLLTAENIEKNDEPLDRKAKEDSSSDTASIVNDSYNEEETNQGVYIDKLDNNNIESYNDKILNSHHIKNYDNTHHRSHHHKSKNENYIRLRPEYNDQHKYFEVFLPKYKETGKPRTIYVEIDMDKNEFVLLDEEIVKKLNGVKPVRIELDEFSQIADTAFDYIHKHLNNKHHNYNLNEEDSYVNSYSDINEDTTNLDIGKGESTQNNLNPFIHNIKSNQQLIPDKTGNVNDFVNVSENLVTPNKYINQTPFHVESRIDTTAHEIPNDNLEFLENTNPETHIYQTGSGKATPQDTTEFNENSSNIDLELGNIAYLPESLGIHYDDNSIKKYEVTTKDKNITFDDNYFIQLEENNNTAVNNDFDNNDEFSKSEITNLNEPIFQTEIPIQEKKLKSSPNISIESNLTQLLTAGISKKSPQSDELPSENRLGYLEHSSVPDIPSSKYTNVPIITKEFAKALETNSHLQSLFPIYATLDMLAEATQETALDSDFGHPSISSNKHPLDFVVAHQTTGTVPFCPERRVSSAEPSFQYTSPILPSPPIECVVRRNKGSEYSPFNRGFSWLPAYSRIEELRLPCDKNPSPQESIVQLPIQENVQLTGNIFLEQVASDQPIPFKDPRLFDDVPSLSVNSQEPSLSTVPYHLEEIASVLPKYTPSSKLDLPKSLTGLDTIPNYPLIETPFTFMPDSIENAVNSPCPMQELKPILQPAKSNVMDLGSFKYSPVYNNFKESMIPWSVDKNRHPYPSNLCFANPSQNISPYLERLLPVTHVQPAYKTPTLDFLPISFDQSYPGLNEDYRHETKPVSLLPNTAFPSLNPQLLRSSFPPITLPGQNLLSNIPNITYAILPDQNKRNYPPFVSNYLTSSAILQQNQIPKSLQSNSVPILAQDNLCQSKNKLQISLEPEALEHDLQRQSIKYGIPLSKILKSLKPDMLTNVDLCDENQMGYEESLLESDLPNLKTLDSSLFGPSLELKNSLVQESSYPQYHTITKGLPLPYSSSNNPPTKIIQDSSLIGSHLSTLSTNNCVVSDKNKNANEVILTESDIFNLLLDSSLVGPHLEIGSLPIVIDSNNYHSDILTSHTDVPTTVISQIEPTIENQYTHLVQDCSLINSHISSLSPVKPFLNNDIQSINDMIPMKTDLTDITNLDSSLIDAQKNVVTQLAQTEFLQREESAGTLSDGSANKNLHKTTQYLPTNLLDNELLIQSNSETNLDNFLTDTSAFHKLKTPDSPTSLDASINQNDKPSEIFTVTDALCNLGSSFNYIPDEINSKETLSAFESVRQSEISLLPSIHKITESPATSSVPLIQLDNSLIGPSLHPKNPEISHAFDYKDLLDSSLVGPSLLTVPFSVDKIQMINKDLQTEAHVANLVPLDSSLIGPEVDFESPLEQIQNIRQQNLGFPKTSVSNPYVYDTPDFVPCNLVEEQAPLDTIASDLEELLSKFTNEITKSQLSPFEQKPCDKLLSSISQISSDNNNIPTDFETLFLNNQSNTPLSLHDELASEFSPITLTCPTLEFSPMKSTELDSNYFPTLTTMTESRPHAQGVPQKDSNWLEPITIQNILQTSPSFRPVLENIPVPLISNTLPLPSVSKLYPRLSIPNVYTPVDTIPQSVWTTPSNMLDNYIPLFPKKRASVLSSELESMTVNSEYIPTVFDDIMSILPSSQSLPSSIPVFKNGEIISPSLLNTMPILDSYNLEPYSNVPFNPQFSEVRGPPPKLVTLPNESSKAFIQQLTSRPRPESNIIQPSSSLDTMLQLSRASNEFNNILTQLPPEYFTPISNEFKEPIMYASPPSSTFPETISVPSTRLPISGPYVDSLLTATPLSTNPYPAKPLTSKFPNPLIPSKLTPMADYTYLTVPSDIAFKPSQTCSSPYLPVHPSHIPFITSPGLTNIFKKLPPPFANPISPIFCEPLTTPYFSPIPKSGLPRPYICPTNGYSSLPAPINTQTRPSNPITSDYISPVDSNILSYTPLSSNFKKNTTEPKLLNTLPMSNLGNQFINANQWLPINSNIQPTQSFPTNVQNFCEDALESNFLALPLTEEIPSSHGVRKESAYTYSNDKDDKFYEEPRSQYPIESLAYTVTPDEAAKTFLSEDSIELEDYLLTSPETVNNHVSEPSRQPKLYQHHHPTPYTPRYDKPLSKQPHPQFLSRPSLIETIPKNIYDNTVPSTSPLEHAGSLPPSYSSSPLLKLLTPFTSAQNSHIPSPLLLKPSEDATRPHNKLPINEKLQSLSCSPYYTAPNQDIPLLPIDQRKLRNIPTPLLTPVFSKVPTNTPSVPLSKSHNLISPSFLDNYVQLHTAHYEPQSKTLTSQGFVKPSSCPHYLEPIISHISPSDMQISAQYITPISPAASLKKSSTSTPQNSLSPVSEYSPITSYSNQLSRISPHIIKQASTNHIIPTTEIDFQTPTITLCPPYIPNCSSKPHLLKEPLETLSYRTPSRLSNTTTKPQNTFKPKSLISSHQYTDQLLYSPYLTQYLQPTDLYQSEPLSNIQYTKKSNSKLSPVKSQSVSPSSFIQPFLPLETVPYRQINKNSVPLYSLPSALVYDFPDFKPNVIIPGNAQFISQSLIESVPESLQSTSPNILLSNPKSSNFQSDAPLVPITFPDTNPVFPEISPIEAVPSVTSPDIPLLNYLPFDFSDYKHSGPCDSLVPEIYEIISPVNLSPTTPNIFLKFPLNKHFNSPGFNDIIEPLPRSADISASTGLETLSRTQDLQNAKMMEEIEPYVVTSDLKDRLPLSPLAISQQRQFHPAFSSKYFITPQTTKTLPSSNYNTLRPKPCFSIFPSMPEKDEQMDTSNLISLSQIKSKPLITDYSPFNRRASIPDMSSNDPEPDILNLSSYPTLFNTDLHTSTYKPRLQTLSYSNQQLPSPSPKQLSLQDYKDLIQDPLPSQVLSSSPTNTEPHLVTGPPSLQIPFYPSSNSISPENWRSFILAKSLQKTPLEVTPDKESIQTLLNKHSIANKITPPGKIYSNEPTISELRTEIDDFEPVNNLLEAKEPYREHIENVKLNEDNYNVPEAEYIRPQRLLSKLKYFYANNHLGKGPQVFNILSDTSLPVSSHTNVTIPSSSVSPENTIDFTDMDTTCFGSASQLDTVSLFPGNIPIPIVGISPNSPNPYLKYDSELKSPPNNLDIADTPEMSPIPNTSNKYLGYKTYNLPSFGNPLTPHNLGTPTQMYSSVVSYATPIPAARPSKVQQNPSHSYFQSPTEIYEPIMSEDQMTTPIQTKLGLDSFQKSLESNKYNPKKDILRYVDGINEDSELKTSLINHISKNEDVKNNLLNNNAEMKIPIGNIAIISKEPDDADIIKTNNPSIGLKVWKSNVKIVEAELKLKFKDLSANNFMPIVNSNLDEYDKEEIRKIVKSYIDEKYGDHIEINKPYIIDNNYAVIKDFDHNVVGNIYNFLWPTHCV